jgi:hypothetical protein
MFGRCGESPRLGVRHLRGMVKVVAVVAGIERCKRASVGGVGVHPDPDLDVAQLGALIRMTSLGTFTRESVGGTGLQRSRIAVHVSPRMGTVGMS